MSVKLPYHYINTTANNEPLFNSKPGNKPEKKASAIKTLEKIKDVLYYQSTKHTIAHLDELSKISAEICTRYSDKVDNKVKSLNSFVGFFFRLFFDNSKEVKTIQKKIEDHVTCLTERIKATQKIGCAGENILEAVNYGRDLHNALDAAYDAKCMPGEVRSSRRVKNTSLYFKRTIVMLAGQRVQDYDVIVRNIREKKEVLKDCSRFPKSIEDYQLLLTRLFVILALKKGADEKTNIGDQSIETWAKQLNEDLPKLREIASRSLSFGHPCDCDLTCNSPDERLMYCNEMPSGANRANWTNPHQKSDNTG